MNDSNPPPEQWRPLFDKIGVEFGYRPLATRTGMNHTRLRRLLRGDGTTDKAVRELAKTFGVTPARIRELRGESADLVYEPFILSDDAARLNDGERRVIRAMVQALLKARDEGNSSDDSKGGPVDPLEVALFESGEEPESDDGDHTGHQAG